MDDFGGNLQAEISALAARLVVEEGLEFGPAKRRAVKQLGRRTRPPLPTNERLEEAVREYIALFCIDTQPAELLALRRLALTWMDRLQAFRPYLGGAVWRGTATRLTDIHIALFCDDIKGPAIALINERASYQSHTACGIHGRDVEALILQVRCPELGQHVTIHLLIYGHDDLRGALHPDAKGQSRRGSLAALRTVLDPVTAVALHDA